MRDAEKRYENAKKAEEYVREVVSTHHRDWNLICTGHRYAEVDAISYKSRTHELNAVIEIKTRNHSMTHVSSVAKMTTDIDTKKLQALKAVSERLRVPSYVFVYLAVDGTVLEIPITDENGDWVCRKEDKDTLAPSGFAGGSVPKSMSALDLTGVSIIKTHGKVMTI